MSTNQIFKNLGDRDLISFRDILNLAKANRLLVFTVSFMIMSLATTYQYLKGSRYHASLVLGISNPNTSQAPLVGLGDEANFKLGILTQFTKSPDFAQRVFEMGLNNKAGVDFMRTPRGLQRVYSRLGLRPDRLSLSEMKEIPKDLMAQVMINQVQLSSDPFTNQLTITAIAEKPEHTIFLTRTAAEVLMKKNHEKILQKVRDVKAFLELQTNEQETKLKDLESELYESQVSNGVLSFRADQDSALKNLNSFEENYVKYFIQRSSAERLIKEIEKEMSKVRNEIQNPTFSASNLYLSQLQHRLSTLNYQMSIARTNSANAETEKEDRDKEIKSVVSEYTKALDSRLELKEAAMMTPLEYYQALERQLADARKLFREARSFVDAYESHIDSSKRKIVNLIGQSRHLISLERTIGLAQDLYTTLKKQLLEARVQEASTLNDVSIITFPVQPLEPSSISLKTTMALSLLLSLAVSMALIILKESLLSVVRNRYDLMKINLPVLAEIPEFELAKPEFGIRSAFKISGNTKSINNSEYPNPVRDFANSHTSDIIRTLRLKLDRSFAADISSRVILVTSAEPEVGKSFISSNLAYAYAQSGMKTLLVGANFRNSGIAKFFPDFESTSLLSSGDNLENLKAQIQSASSNLDLFIPNAIPNPLDYLDSKWLAEFIFKVRQNYQVIILDSAAILPHMDTILISAFADHVLIASKFRGSHRADVLQALEKLSEIYSGPVSGIINLESTETVNLNSTATPQKFKKVG